MFNLQELNFDFDGDGYADSHAEFLDTDGDGVLDTALVDVDMDGNPDAALVDMNQDGTWDCMIMDTDGDGLPDTLLMDADMDGIPETVGFDTNRDGFIDSYRTELDTDGDGVVDTLIMSDDYNQDGVAESQVTYQDFDGDGRYDAVVKAYDADGDGQADSFKSYLNLGDEQLTMREQFLDTDGDGRVDTYILSSDTDSDGVFDAVEVYEYQPQNGAILLSPLDPESCPTVAGCRAEELGNFDPTVANEDAVSGNPTESMQLWEFQGDTGRCALYSQKFVIEELTGQEIDIEELADLAEENGWFDESSGTPLLNMDKVLDYYGIDNDMSFHNDIEQLEDCLNAGGKVIVAVDADEIWYGENDSIFTPGEGPNHAVQVIGIDRTDADNPMVILNDSGNPDGCGELVPMDVFLDAWEDGNCQMISCY